MAPRPALGRVAFSWNGLPQYAARLIRASIDHLGEPCIVVGSRPRVPVRGMEQILGQPVHWVDAERSVTWREIGLSIPDIFVQSGWSYPAFSALGREVKAAGGRVIGLSDANWRGDLRQLVLGPLSFRLRHLPHFDAMIVPGRQGERLMCYFGLPRDRVRHGMYAADQKIFSSGPPLQQRPKEFLFVGQFIPRKDVLGLARAFLRFSSKHPEWTLRFCGDGVQRGELPTSKRIHLEPFVQPEALAERFQAARFFVLPSLREAWGVVVHEAGLCGCALVLSTAIGSADDLATERNAIRFQAGNEDALVAALVAAASRDNSWLKRAESESLRLAQQFSPQRFATEVVSLINEIRGRSVGAMT